MKLIIGLGNPGEKYLGTRHNAGFEFADRLSRQKELSSVESENIFSKKEKFEAEVCEITAKGEKIILAKPQTFMNLSGRAVAKILAFYKIDKSDLVVISDDIDLNLGQVRIRREGSSGGHKGLQNIIDHIGENFVRIRLGIKPIDGDADRSENFSSEIDTANFVLDKFAKRELSILDKEIDLAIDYLLPFLGGREEIPSHSLDVRVDSL